jgi:hypothetical protein
VRFALQTPEQYRIATMGGGIHFQGDATQIVLALWTAGHGVAALLIAKPYLPVA